MSIDFVSPPVEITPEVEADWPTHWNTREKSHYLEIGLDRLRVKYTGKGLHPYDVGNYFEKTIRSAKPLPSNVSIAYFEITIIDAGARGSIGIGLSTDNFILNKKPGWDDSSWGYHSDGKKCNDSVRGENYGHPFSTGDVIGCGVNYAKQEIFFTLNGLSLGTAFRRLSETVYPTIGLHSPGEVVMANFGQDVFRFDVQQLIAQEKYQREREIDEHAVPVRTMHELVRKYLLHYGYGDTLLAFDKSHKPDEPRERSLYDSLANRKRLRELIMHGDVKSAIELTSKLYTGLLQHHVDVYFYLCAQQFLELIRQLKFDEAVVYAQQHLGPFIDSEHVVLAQHLKDCCALLCYAEPLKSPMRHLLSITQREFVADQLNAAIVQIDNQKHSQMEYLCKYLIVAQRKLRENNGNKGELFDLDACVNGDMKRTL